MIITGVSSGIGYDTCQYLIDKGYHVIGSVRKAEDKHRLKSQWKEHFDCLLFDVTDEDAIDKSFTDVKEIIQDREIFALINNAGLAIPGPLALLDNNELRRQLDVNVLSAQYITNVFLPLITKNNQTDPSKIIMIGSVSGLFTSPFMGAYCISKYALEAMSDAYRRELMLYNIKVSIIEPGPIKTKIWSKNKGALQKYEDTDYGFMVKKADKIIANTEKNALPSEVISQCIYDILESKNPKPRYLVTKNKIAFRLISKWLPTKLVDKMIWKNLSNKEAKNYRGF